jgi:hypothetical protein
MARSRTNTSYALLFATLHAAFPAYPSLPLRVCQRNEENKGMTLQ